MPYPIRFGLSAGLFGIYHPPEDPAAAARRRPGVVLCNPIGLDEQLSGRVLRHLAQRLSSRGFPVLRFDYPGSGDSRDSEPLGVGAWIASIRDALTWMSDNADVTELTLVGVQLGATLALSSLATLSPHDPLRGRVSSVVVWSGCASGSQFVRTARAHQLVQAASAAKLPRGVLQSGALWLEGEALSELSRCNLEGIAVTPAPRLLVVGSDPRSSHSRVVTALRPSFPELHYLGGPELARFTGEWFQPLVPTAGADAICEWMDQQHATPSLSNEPKRRASIARCSLTTESIVETHVRFANGRLLGVLTEPADRSRLQASSVMMVSSGWSDRTGPSRCHVDLSRHLARRGHRSFRFDVTGMGEAADPQAARELDPYGPQCLADATAALRWLENDVGAGDICLMGVCSGAYVSFRLACDAKRVSSLVLVNPLWLGSEDGRPPELLVAAPEGASPTFARVSRREKLRALAVRSAGLARGVLQARKARAFASRLVKSVYWSWQKATSGATVAELGLRRLLGDGTRILTVLGSDDRSREYLTSQIGSDLSYLQRYGHFTVRFCDDTDHTFSDPTARKWLMEEVASFLARQHSGDAVAPAGQRLDSSDAIA